MRRHTWLLLGMIAGALVVGCGREGSEREKERDRPAAAQPGVVRLKAEAQKGVGLVVEKAAAREVGETVPAAGWLVVPPGREVTMKAPSVGFVVPPSGEEGFALGTKVTRDEQLLGSLEVLLSPVERADLISVKQDAEILIQQSFVTWQRLKAELERLEKTGGAVSGLRLAELKEGAEKARIAYEQAQHKLPYLPQQSNGAPLSVKPVPLRAPITGQIVKLHVSPRQLVVQGDPLWTVADWSTLWVRVAVFERDLPRIVRGAAAVVTVPGQAQPLVATPVDVPQSVEPGRRTVDVFYELPNPGGKGVRNLLCEAPGGPFRQKVPDTFSGHLRPGQAVSVGLPVGKTAERIVIAHSAVLWDGMGNSWVYVQTAPEEFRRRRVELGGPAGDGVAVEQGLQAGEAVVTVGAETLYGEEFKSDIPALEEEEEK